MRPRDILLLDDALCAAGLSRCARRDAILAGTGAKISRIAVEPVVAAGALSALSSVGVAAVAGRVANVGTAERRRDIREVFIGTALPALVRLAASVDHDEIGSATGVPACCRRAFDQRGRESTADGMRPTRFSEVGAASCLEAGLFDKGLIGFIPCGPDCTRAEAQAIHYALWLLDRCPALAYELTGPGTYIVSSHSALRLGALRHRWRGRARLVEQRGRPDLESVAPNVEWAEISAGSEGLRVLLIASGGQCTELNLETGRACVVRSRRSGSRIERVRARLAAMGLRWRSGVYLAGGGERPSPAALAVASLSDELMVDPDGVGPAAVAELSEAVKPGVFVASCGLGRRRRDGTPLTAVADVQRMKECDYVLCEWSGEVSRPGASTLLRSHIESVARISAVKADGRPLAVLVVLPLLPAGEGDVQEFGRAWKSELARLAPHAAASVATVAFVQSQIAAGAVEEAPAGAMLELEARAGGATVYFAERWPVSLDEALCLRAG